MSNELLPQLIPSIVLFLAGLLAVLAGLSFAIRLIDRRIFFVLAVLALLLGLSSFMIPTPEFQFPTPVPTREFHEG